MNRRVRYAEGIHIGDPSDYDFASAARRTVCPTLCIGGESALSFFDTIGYAGTQQFEAGCDLFSNCRVEIMHGPESTINMINQAPEDFVTLCTTFLDNHNL